MPCGEVMSVPRIWQMPRLVAKMTIGARLLSRARFRYVKHSMSSMCTCQEHVTEVTQDKVKTLLRWSL